jgi:hypothetical protein
LLGYRQTNDQRTRREMTGLIVAAIVALVILAGVVITVRLTRPADQVPPRRREFNRLKETQASAVKALNGIDDVIDSYQLSVDEVGRQLIVDVRDQIKAHDRRRTEIEK